MRNTTFALVNGSNPSRRVTLAAKNVLTVDFSEFMAAALAVGLPLQDPTVAGVPCSWRKAGDKVYLTPKQKAPNAWKCGPNGSKKYNRTDKDAYYYR